jgi:hypothetical protein
MAPRYQRALLLAGIALLIFVGVVLLGNVTNQPSLVDMATYVKQQSTSERPLDTPLWDRTSDGSQHEGIKTIMPKLGNTTIRAELGRATWRLLHTMAVSHGAEPQRLLWPVLFVGP